MYDQHFEVTTPQDLPMSAADGHQCLSRGATCTETTDQVINYESVRWCARAHKQCLPSPIPIFSIIAIAKLSATRCVYLCLYLPCLELQQLVPCPKRSIRSSFQRGTRARKIFLLQETLSILTLSSLSPSPIQIRRIRIPTSRTSRRTTWQPSSTSITNTARESVSWASTFLGKIS